MRVRKILYVGLASALLTSTQVACGIHPKKTSSAHKETPVRGSSGKVVGFLSERSNMTLFFRPSANAPQKLRKATFVEACVDKEKKTWPSPNGKHLAFSVVRNCGATTDFSTLLIITETKENSEKKTLGVFSQSVTLDVAWENNQSVIVRYPKSNEVALFGKTRKYKDLFIKYIKDLKTAHTRTEYSEFSQVNFGATSMAAGIPLKLMQRMAGWAQFKSGVYKKEWGHWTNPKPPFGDDPKDAKLVNKGIKFYKSKFDSQ